MPPPARNYGPPSSSGSLVRDSFPIDQTRLARPRSFQRRAPRRPLPRLAARFGGFRPRVHLLEQPDGDGGLDVSRSLYIAWRRALFSS